MGGFGDRGERSLHLPVHPGRGVAAVPRRDDHAAPAAAEASELRGALVLGADEYQREALRSAARGSSRSRTSRRGTLDTTEDASRRSTAPPSPRPPGTPPEACSSPEPPTAAPPSSTCDSSRSTRPTSSPTCRQRDPDRTARRDGSAQRAPFASSMDASATEPSCWPAVASEREIVRPREGPDDAAYVGDHVLEVGDGRDDHAPSPRPNRPSRRRHRSRRPVPVGTRVRRSVSSTTGRSLPRGSPRSRGPTPTSRCSWAMTRAASPPTSAFGSRTTIPSRRSFALTSTRSRAPPWSISFHRCATRVSSPSGADGSLRLLHLTSERIVASLAPPEAPDRARRHRAQERWRPRHPRGRPARALWPAMRPIPKSPAGCSSARPGTRATRNRSTSGSRPAPPTSSSRSSASSRWCSEPSRPRSTRCSSRCPSRSWPRSTHRSSPIRPSARRSSPRSRSWPRCPSVVVGFIAGLWLASRVEEHIVPVLLMVILLPALGTSGVLFWDALPHRLRTRLRPGHRTRGGGAPVPARRSARPRHRSLPSSARSSEPTSRAGSAPPPA